jgi:hypothetical protein
MRRNLKGRLSFVVIGSLVSGGMLSSCAAFTPPQSRAEFIGNQYVKKETYTVPRSLDAVVASVEKRADLCVNKTQVSQTSASVASRSTSAYNMYVEKVSPKRAELTYQIHDSNMAMQPKGGLYRFAADFEAKGSRTTQVTLYHAPMSDEIVKAVSEWTKGHTESCHGYGGK